MNALRFSGCRSGCAPTQPCQFITQPTYSAKPCCVRPKLSCSGSHRPQQICSISADPNPPPRPPTQPPCWIPPVILMGITTLISALILKHKQKKPAVKEQPSDIFIPSPEQDPRAHQRALARTRQGSYICKAVAFMKAGDNARAHMELTRALQENCICRCPVVEGHHSKEELLDLYRMHIKFGEVPPQFATLLQLQEMLGISQDEAEKIELDVLETPGAFSI